MAGRFSVEAVFKSIDRFSAPIRFMGKTMTKFTRSAERGLRKVNKALISVGKNMAAGFRRGAAFATVAVTGLAFALKTVADRADSLAKRARRLQFPVEDLQEWRFVAEQSGLTIDEFDKSLEGMAKRFGEAKAGTGSLFTFLQKTDKQLLRNVMSTTSVADALSLMIQAIQDSEDPLKSAALANAAFGRQGLKLATLAELGAKKIARLRAEQRENSVITKQQAENAEAFNDALNSLKRAGIGFLQQALLPMMPLLTRLLKDTRQWVLANRELISGRLLTFFKFVVENFDDILGRIKLFAKAILVFGAFTAVISTLTGVLTLFNLVAALNPIGLMVLSVLALMAGFSALVIWIDDVIENFEKLPKVIQFILSPFEVLIRSIKFVKDNFGVIKKAAEFAGTAISGLIGLDGEEQAAPSAQIVTREERIATQINEQRTTASAELVIKDETGRAELTTESTPGIGIQLQETGAF